MLLVYLVDEAIFKHDGALAINLCLLCSYIDSICIRTSPKLEYYVQ